MSATEMTSKQRAKLRSQAHRLSPVVHIGNAGVTKALLTSILEAFNTRELIKVRILESAPAETRDIADTLRDAVEGSSVVQMIGRTVVLHRPFPEEPDEK